MARWRSWRRRKWFLLGVPVLLGVLMIPASGQSAIPASTAYRGRIDQGGVTNVTTVYVTAAGHNPTTYSISVRASTGSAAGSAGSTGTAGSILVDFGGHGTVCLTSLDASTTVPGTFTFPTSGTETWTWSTKNNATCGGNAAGGTPSTITVAYALSASP